MTAALELQVERTRRILGAAGEGFHMIGMDGRIVDCNDAFARMLGYTREELTTMRIKEIDPRGKLSLVPVLEGGAAAADAQG